MMALGKRWFGFQRFKKLWRALAIRAKAHHLDQSGNLLLVKRNALTTEPEMQIWHVKMWIIAIIKSYCKKLHNQKNMLNRSLVAHQLWCWVPQWRYELETLRKCVCKVVIYHPPETQQFIMIWRCCSRPWMLWGSDLHKSENMNTQEWLIWPPFVVGGLVIIHSIYANSRIHVIKPFKCLACSKHLLP